MSEKVYCKRCFHRYRRAYTNRDECSYKDNVDISYKEDWFDNHEIRKHKKLAKEINKNNDCKWFKRKEVSF
jgi:hypothetical protein